MVEEEKIIDLPLTSSSLSIPLSYFFTNPSPKRLMNENKTENKKKHDQ